MYTSNTYPSHLKTKHETIKILGNKINKIYNCNIVTKLNINS
jgi:hypothetical protein